jgi:hypothetical protein
MDANCEVIALLLSESDMRRSGPSSFRRGAQRLVRDAAGRVTLEAIESKEDFDRTAKSTGCFVRGKEIRDPRTLEVIGYEMEEVSPVDQVARN